LATRWLEPDNPYIQDSVGWYFYRAGDYDAALEYLERSYRQMPSAEVAAHLGEVLWAAKRRDEARRVFKEGLARNPKSDILLETMKRLGVSVP
jgi:tetratricopeptide (TPR) repeat protein